MSKTTVKADINFEQELWKAANELRGAVAENQYKDYVLPMIFLKHMSERYEMRREELTALIHDKNSNYFTTDEAEINYVLEDADEYLSKNVYIIPKEATWEYLKANAEQDNIKVIVDDAFDVLDATLAKFRPDLKGILPRIFVKSQLTARQVGGLINLLSNPKLSQKENPEREIEVTVSVTLSKTIKVKVSDYDIVDSGKDEDGEYFEDIDYSNCDLKGAVEKQIVLPQTAHMYVKSNPKVHENLSNWCVDDLEVNLEE
jgi:type I restriction-modification system DNA methylase subunit